MATRLQRLLDRYAEIAAAPPRSISDDEQRSLDFYRAHLAQAAGATPSTARVDRWVAAANRVAAWVDAHGALPSNTRAAGAIDEARLSDWLTKQRGRRTWLSGFQTGRLEALSAQFSWDPREDAWHATALRYVETVAQAGARPSERSTAAEERHLAEWWRRARAANRTGALAPQRAAMVTYLERLEGL